MHVNDLPDNLLNALDPTRVNQDGSATGWVREPRAGSDTAAVFSHPSLDLDQIIVPLLR